MRSRPSRNSSTVSSTKHKYVSIDEAANRKALDLDAKLKKFQRAANISEENVSITATRGSVELIFWHCLSQTL